MEEREMIGILGPGSRFLVQGSRFLVQGSWFLGGFYKQDCRIAELQNFIFKTIKFLKFALQK